MTDYQHITPPQGTMHQGEQVFGIQIGQSWSDNRLIEHTCALHADGKWYTVNADSPLTAGGIDIAALQEDAAKGRRRFDPDLALLRRAIADPGQFCQRVFAAADNDGHENLANWQARAVTIALMGEKKP